MGSVPTGSDDGSGAEPAAAFTETMPHRASAVAVVTPRLPATAPAVESVPTGSDGGPDTGAESAAAFTEVMADLASAVAVVTARQGDGSPCGLLVSSVCSYSVAPPSVLVAVGESARAYPALAVGAPFGVHLLSGADLRAAEVFARRGADKFGAVRWDWDGSVPRLTDVSRYLRCVSAAVFPHGDHAVVIGEVVRCERQAGRPREPLVHYRRRLGWRLAAPVDPGPAPPPPS